MVNWELGWAANGLLRGLTRNTLQPVKSRGRAPGEDGSRLAASRITANGKVILSETTTAEEAAKEEAPKYK